MSVTDTVLLIASVVLLLISGFQLLCLAALSYFARKMLATDDVWREMNRISATMEDLQGQVTKLRTSKAGRISREKAAARQEVPEELEGLSEDDLALFR